MWMGAANHGRILTYVEYERSGLTALFENGALVQVYGPPAKPGGEMRVVPIKSRKDMVH
jgi:hypothetical protein